LRLVIDQYRAGATLTAIAPLFCPGETGNLTDVVQQQQVICYRVFALPTVQNQRQY
jgi:hypothetical protein